MSTSLLLKRIRLVPRCGYSLNQNGQGRIILKKIFPWVRQIGGHVGTGYVGTGIVIMSLYCFSRHNSRFNQCKPFVEMSTGNFISGVFLWPGVASYSVMDYISHAKSRG